MGFENGRLVAVRLSATVGAKEQVNVLHYDLDDALGPDDNDPQSLADTFRDDVLPSYKALFNVDYQVQPVVVYEEKDPLNPTAPRSSWTSGTAAAGTKTASTDWLPDAITGLVSLRTNHLGRRFRGRIFLGGALFEADQSSSVLSTAQKTLYNTFLAAIPREPDIAGPGSSSTAKWCVYSRTQRAANLDPYASPVVATILRDNVHWLRSRQAY